MLEHVWNGTKKLNAVIYLIKWPQMNEKAEKRGRKRYLHRKGGDDSAAWSEKK